MSQALPLPFRQALPWTGFVALLFLLNYMSRSTLTPLLVPFEQDLNVGHAQATSLLLMQSVGFCLSLAISGFLLSRIKPRHVAAIPLMGSGAILLAMPLVQNIEQARLLFLALGFGIGFYFPAGMATLSSLVHPKDWGKAVSIHELAPNSGFILIPLLAQAALLITDWRGAFALMGGLMICGGGAFLLWGRGGNQLCAPPSFKGCRELARNPGSWAVALLLTISMIGEFSIFSILQIFLVGTTDFSADTANMLISSSRLVTPFVVITAGWAADRFPAGRIVRVCLVLHALALILMSLDNTALILTGVVIQAVSMAFVFPPLFKLFAACFPADVQPVLLSLCMPVAGLISAGGIPFFIGYCGEYYTFSVALISIAVLSLLSAWSVSLLRQRS